MARVKGSPKTGGRKKGTPNKRTQSVQQLLDEKGVNPIEAMADVLIDAIQTGDQDKIVFIADKLAPYYSPKLAATKLDVEGELGVNHENAGLQETLNFIKEATSSGG